MSVFAGILSAVAMEIAGDSDDLERLLVRESEDGNGERLSKCIGLGAGIGGLLFNGPVGRFITRSGASIDVFWYPGLVFNLHSSLLLCNDFLSSSSFLPVDLLSQRSFLLTKLETLLSSDASPFNENLLPHVDCFNKLSRSP